MKNILFVASEGVPFIKTGGLADVVGSLPKCIDKRYCICTTCFTSRNIDSFERLAMNLP